MRFLFLLVAACGHPVPPASAPPKAVVLISANAEWKVVKALYPSVQMQPTPWGETFEQTIDGARVVFLHGGWGKVAAAGSTQYAIDRWHARYLINLGTCGGFAGSIEKHAVLVARESCEACGNMAVFAAGTDVVMRRLWGELPAWLARFP